MDNFINFNFTNSLLEVNVKKIGGSLPKVWGDILIVDWSGGWATPRGLAFQMRPWSERSETVFCCESEAAATSKAAHRTPPGKRPAGTEIIPTLW